MLGVFLNCNRIYLDFRLEVYSWIRLSLQEKVAAQSM